MPDSGCPLSDTPFGNQPKAPAGLPGFQRYPFIRDVAFDPGGVGPSRFIDGLHAAFNDENRLSLRDLIYFVAQSHTPHDRCLRFGPHVTMTPARLAPSLPATALAGRDLHPQDIAGFAQRTLIYIDTEGASNSPGAKGVGFGALREASKIRGILAEEMSFHDI